mmetsp:Transcript_91593/g.236430  ORF Transcript_91593/g.236430 Transcript_91593/m.236430 type:complete len:249 (+) Transcript_91593:567-1313(+)
MRVLQVSLVPPLLSILCGASCRLIRSTSSTSESSLAVWSQRCGNSFHGLRGRITSYDQPSLVTLTWAGSTARSVPCPRTPSPWSVPSLPPEGKERSSCDRSAAAAACSGSSAAASSPVGTWRLCSSALDQGSQLLRLEGGSGSSGSASAVPSSQAEWERWNRPRRQASSNADTHRAASSALAASKVIVLPRVARSKRQPLARPLGMRKEMRCRVLAGAGGRPTTSTCWMSEKVTSVLALSPSSRWPRV